MHGSHQYTSFLEDLYTKSCAKTTKCCKILCHNLLLHGKLWLVKECQWVMWGHTFTNHNSPCGELWHKIVPFSMIPTFSLYKFVEGFFIYIFHTQQEQVGLWTSQVLSSSECLSSAWQPKKYVQAWLELDTSLQIMFKLELVIKFKNLSSAWFCLVY